MSHSIFFIVLSIFVCVLNITHAQKNPQSTQQKCNANEVMVGIDEYGKIICTSIMSVLESAEPSELEAVLQMQRRKHTQAKLKREQEALKKEELLIDQWVKRLTSSKYQIIKTQWKNYLLRPELMARSARMIPRKDIGMKVFGIRKNSILYTLGFKNGDVLMSVNQMKIQSINQALKIYQKLITTQSIEVELKRRAKVITLQYQLVDHF